MFGWLTALGDVAKAVGLALGLIKDKELRNEGAIAQDDRTKTDTLKTLGAVAAPISNDERDGLWDDNAKRFGPSNEAGER